IFKSESLSCLLTRVGASIYTANNRACTKSLGVDGRKRVISDMGEGEAYEKISSTAKLVAHIRSFTDIPFTKEIAQQAEQ
ncbi:MAG: hypothetical protein ACXVIT_12335, partial [Halobacteriota archaeon]